MLVGSEYDDVSSALSMVMLVSLLLILGPPLVHVVLFIHNSTLFYFHRILSAFYYDITFLSMDITLFDISGRITLLYGTSIPLLTSLVQRVLSMP